MGFYLFNFGMWYASTIFSIKIHLKSEMRNMSLQQIIRNFMTGKLLILDRDLSKIMYV